ncbi:MAG: tetratricopeptide repeat protein [Campylobacterota bacterium]|nr:tetratricopeptide repeat protein [Campylobacterota bacterium]
MKKVISLLVLLTTLSFGNSYDKALELFDKKEYKESLRLLKQANNEGNIDSLYTLGYMYYYGYGTKKDYSEAIKWFLKASKKGSVKSFEYLGYIYGNGQGVNVNDKKAIYYYELGIKDNGSGSMCDLSEYYIKGWGVQKNYFKAIELVKKGHELGNSNCKKIWEKYNLSSKKEKNQLNYNTEKKLCKKNMNINPNIAIEHCEYSVQMMPTDNNSRLYLGLSYFNLGRFKEALKEYDFLEEQLLKDITKAVVFLQKGNILVAQNRNDEALVYFTKSLQLSEEKEYSYFYAQNYNGIGLCNKQNNNNSKALQNFNKALIYATNEGMKMNISNNIALVYLNQEKFTDAIDSLKIALEISGEINNYIQIDLIKSNLAMAYLFNNNIKKAKMLSKESIIGAEKTHNQMALYNSYLVYSAVMEELGNKKESDKYFNKANEIGNELGMSFKDESTDINLSPLSILKNMFKKSRK